MPKTVFLAKASFKKCSLNSYSLAYDRKLLKEDGTNGERYGTISKRWSHNGATALAVNPGVNCHF